MDPTIKAYIDETIEVEKEGFNVEIKMVPEPVPGEF